MEVQKNNNFIIIILILSYNEVEKDTITMVLYHLLASSYIEEDLKSRIRIAAGLGRKNHCKVFSCQINLKPPKA